MTSEAFISTGLSNVLSIKMIYLKNFCYSCEDNNFDFQNFKLR